jgi:hydroxymethylbilane synthase
MRRPSSTDRLVVATRASRLALTQTNIVVDRLRAAHPGLDVAVLEVTTTGDRDQRPFAEIGGKGLFTSEVEKALLDGRADLAVHSAKDLTAELAPGCALLAVPERGPRRDVVVTSSGADDAGTDVLAALPPGARIGTSSMRRRALLAELRRDLDPVELRGNLDTRVRKVEAGECDAAILAAAGLERLGLDRHTGATLDPSWWVPPPGQGALAIEGLSARADLRDLLAPITHETSARELACERAFAARLEGGCSVPLGCTAVVAGDRLTITGYLGALDGRALRESLTGSPADADELGLELAEAILVSGGDLLLEELKAEPVPVVEEP